jgi:hypothetical protein
MNKDKMNINDIIENMKVQQKDDGDEGDNTESLLF